MLKAAALLVAAVTLLSAPLVAQETKPVPKDSMRVAIPGCTKGQIFTAGRRTADEPGSVGVPEGMHMRMNGPKAMIAEIKAHEGSMIQITGLIKKGQYAPGGVSVGKGVRISPGASSGGGTLSPNSMPGQIMIDVEGWRPVDGGCPTR